MASISKGYLGLGWGLSLILAIIPVTSWVFGLLTAFKKKSWFFFILRIFFGFNIFWIIDLINMIVSKRLTWLV